MLKNDDRRNREKTKRKLIFQFQTLKLDSWIFLDF